MLLYAFSEKLEITNTHYNIIYSYRCVCIEKFIYLYGTPTAHTLFKNIKQKYYLLCVPLTGSSNIYLKI